jgi:hypothetical protein
MSTRANASSEIHHHMINGGESVATCIEFKGLSHHCMPHLSLSLSLSLFTMNHDVIVIEVK